MKSRKLHSILAVISALAVFAPDITALVGVLAGFKHPWLAVPVRILGAVGLFLSSWTTIRGRFQAVVDAIEKDDVVTKPETTRDSGFTLIPFLLFFAAITASLAVTFPAHGQALDASTGLPKVMLEDPIPTPQLGVKWGRWTTQPATAAGFQINLKTGDYERIAIMAGYGATYHGRQVTIGAVAFAGVGLSANAPNAPQASLLLTLWDSVAIGPGVTMFKGSGGDRIFQGLLTVAFNMTTGATTEGLKGFIDVARVCAVP